jgi:hypothetical protein
MDISEMELVAAVLEKTFSHGIRSVVVVDDEL